MASSATGNGSPNIGRLVNRVGTTVPIAVGLASLAAAYILFLNIGANTDYLTGMLPTFGVVPL